MLMLMLMLMNHCCFDCSLPGEWLAIGVDACALMFGFDCLLASGRSNLSSFEDHVIMRRVQVSRAHCGCCAAQVETSSGAGVGDPFQQPPEQENPYANAEQVNTYTNAEQENTYANAEQFSGAKGETSLLVDLNAAELEEQKPEKQQPQHEMAARTSSSTSTSKSSGSNKGPAATGDLLQFDSPQHAAAAAPASPPTVATPPPVKTSSPPQAPGSPLGDRKQQEAEEGGVQMRNNHSGGAAALAAEFQQGSGQQNASVHAALPFSNSYVQYGIQL